MKRFGLRTCLFLMVFFANLILTVNCQAQDKLPSYGADVTQISVSGLSSGAFMTSQLHVAYSDIVNGVGIVAGGPY